MIVAFNCPFLPMIATWVALQILAACQPERPELHTFSSRLLPDCHRTAVNAAARVSGVGHFQTGGSGSGLLSVVWGAISARSGGAIMPSDATVPIDTGPIVRAEIRELECRYGVVAWFGFHTRRWWALVEGRLVEAATPAGLANAVVAVLGSAGRPSQHIRPCGESRRAGQVRPGRHQRFRRRIRSPRRGRHGLGWLDAPGAISGMEGGVR